MNQLKHREPDDSIEMSMPRENINNIDFNQIESNTNEIRNMVTNNLEQQPDISELYNMIEDLSKNLSTIKGQITKVSNKITELSNSIDENKE